MQAVIFDYDGVIADSLDVHIEIYRIIAKEMGLDIDFNEASGDFFEVDWRRTLRRVGIEEEEGFKQAEKIYAEELAKMKDGIEIFPQIRRLLPKLKEKYKLAIVSNSIESTIKSRLEKEGILEYFDLVMGPHKGFVKPSPEQINECLRRLDIKPEDAVYVGDMDGDIVAAKAAGVKSIGVTYGYHGAHKLEGADILIDSADKILEAIE